MRIHEIQIKDLRGIRDVTLLPSGNNFVIWGPNGSGKSAVVDAIDFLLGGSISRLEGEGAGVLSTAKHGPHIDSDIGTAEVIAQVSLPGEDTSLEVRRSMSDPGKIICPDKGKIEALEPVLEIASQGQYVLARREILRFITTTGGNRAKWIQTLLRLDSIESIRKALGSAANDAKKQSSTANQALEAELSRFKSVAGIEEWTEEKALEVVNTARKVLAADSIETLDSEGIKKDVMAQSITKADATALRLKEALSESIQLWKEETTDLNDSAKQIHKTISFLGQDVEALELLRRHNLIHSGLELLGEDGSCPLCRVEWEKGELEAKLKEQLHQSEDVEKQRKEAEKHISKINSKVEDIYQKLSQVEDSAEKLELTGDLSVALKAKSELGDYKENLKTPINKITPLSADIFSPPSLLSSKDVVSELENLHGKVVALTPELNPEQKAWDLLTRLHEALIRIQDARLNVNLTKDLSERAKILVESYNHAKDAILNSLYDTIKERFVQLYAQLHAEDGEEAFSALLEHTGASLDFKVDFFGRGLHPPHALHSEGHQDSMGICLYLALSEHINEGVVEVVVLDDVVMSVDSGHRRRLCQLIKEQFTNTQFIITTHDRAWAHQLKTEGVVKSNDMVQFCGWSVETGPRVNESDFWERIEECLQNDDVRGAAGYLRGAMEEYFANVCESLQAVVIYRSSGQYTLGDYLPAAYSKYSELIRKAKSSASSWNNQEEVEKLGETQSIASQCYERTQAEQWATNRALHYDSWYTLESADLENVVNAFRDMCDVFECSNCGSLIALSTTALTPDSVRCACKRIDWNLIKKES